MTRQRARIQKQLRLIFIYPIVYVLMWLIPFVYHCMNYHDRWAMRPLYWLTLMATICVAMMGFMDCLVFTLRERPWKHISNSDGTFWGSFVVWSRDRSWDGEEQGVRRVDMLERRDTDASFVTLGDRVGASVQGRPSGPEARLPMFQRVRGSIVRSTGSSDQHRAESEVARLRLAREFGERRREAAEREGIAGIGVLETIPSPSLEESDSGEGIRDGVDKQTTPVS
jgi:G protein-coupled receptor GPR1